MNINSSDSAFRVFINTCLTSKGPDASGLPVFYDPGLFIGSEILSSALLAGLFKSSVTLDATIGEILSSQLSSEVGRSGVECSNEVSIGNNSSAIHFSRTNRTTR